MGDSDAVLQDDSTPMATATSFRHTAVVRRNGARQE